MVEIGKVGGNKQLVFTLSLGYILAGLIVAYFYFFPTLSNPMLSDTLIVLGVLLLLSCFVYAAIKAKSSGEVILVLLGIVFLSILARSIPHLRLTSPPFSDPYFYAISSLNIIDYGTLQPVLAEWYGGVNTHLHWPMMQLFTAGAVKITGIDSMWFFRFQEPLLGGMFALAVFAMAKEVTKNNSVALLSALFASMSDVVIFYQAEYHPQGFAAIFFVLFLYLYLKSSARGGISYRVAALACLVIFLGSHHFSSLLFVLLAAAFIGLNQLISILPDKLGRVTQLAREVRADYNLWLILAVAGIAYHIFIFAIPIYTFFLWTLVELEPAADLLAAGTSARGNVPILTTLLNSAKWGVLFLATFSITRVIRAPKLHELRLLVLLVCILTAGFTATFIFWGPVDRMILFYSPLVSVFAAMTVCRLFTLRRVSFQRTQVIKFTTVLVVGLLLVAGFFNGISIPALYFKSSQPNRYYETNSYSNQLPKMYEWKVAGEWIGIYIPDVEKVAVTWSLRAQPFFFGKRNLNTIISPVPIPTASAHYIMLHPNIPSGEKLEYDRDLILIYDNGEVKIYKWPR